MTSCCASTQDGNAKLRVAVVGDGSGRPQITGIRAAELSFGSIAISTSGAKLAWLYNIVAALAKTPIQDAITREVAAQVRPPFSRAGYVPHATAFSRPVPLPAGRQLSMLEEH